VTTLSMAGTRAMVINKFSNGYYLWSVYINVYNPNSVISSIYTVADEVFVNIRTNGFFGWSGPVNSQPDMFTNTTLGTVILHVASNGFVTLLSYTI